MDWPVLLLAAVLFALLVLFARRPTSASRLRKISALVSTTALGVLLIYVGHFLQAIAQFAFFGDSPVSTRIQSIGVFAVEAASDPSFSLALLLAPIALVTVATLLPIALIPRRWLQVASSAIAFILVQSAIDYLQIPRWQGILGWAITCNIFGAAIVALSMTHFYEWSMIASLDRIRGARFASSLTTGPVFFVCALVVTSAVIVTFRIPTGFRVTIEDPRSISLGGLMPIMWLDLRDREVTGLRMIADSQMTVAAGVLLSGADPMKTIVSRRSYPNDDLKEELKYEEFADTELNPGAIKIHAPVVAADVDRFRFDQKSTITCPSILNRISLLLVRDEMKLLASAESPPTFDVSIGYSKPEVVLMIKSTNEPVEIDFTDFDLEALFDEKPQPILSKVVAYRLGWKPNRPVSIWAMDVADPLFKGDAYSLDISLQSMNEKEFAYSFGNVRKLSFRTSGTILRGDITPNLGRVDSVVAVVTGGKVRQGFATEGELKRGDRIEIRSAVEPMSIRVEENNTFVVEGRYALLSINGELMSNTLWGAFSETTRGIVLGIVISGVLSWLRGKWGRMSGGKTTRDRE